MKIASHGFQFVTSCAEEEVNSPGGGFDLGAHSSHFLCCPLVLLPDVMSLFLHENCTLCGIMQEPEESLKEETRGSAKEQNVHKNILYNPTEQITQTVYIKILWVFNIGELIIILAAQFCCKNKFILFLRSTF